MSSDLTENCNRLRIVLAEAQDVALKAIGLLENAIREASKVAERIDLAEERARKRDAPAKKGKG